MPHLRAGEALDEQEDADGGDERRNGRDDERHGKRQSLLAQQAHVLHHADARGHEQKRQGGEQPPCSFAEVAFSQRLLAERPPALVKAKRNDQQRKPDHRAGRRQRKPARGDLADELECEEDEKAADHAGLSPEARGAVDALASRPGDLRL